MGKQAYYAQIDLDHEKAYAYAKEIMTMNALAADAQEGISAFRENARLLAWDDNISPLCALASQIPVCD